MIRIKSNIDIVTARISGKLEKLKDRDYLLRPVALDVVVLMTERIHKDGVASDGGPIGTYSADYLSLRQRKYKRTADSKVIVSLTRQLENDWSVIATPKGYGIGFLNSFNLQKARWVEEGKGKAIFKLSKSESDYAVNRLNELIRDALN